MAAIGVALGSISAVLVGIFAKFVDLGVWIPLGLIGIVFILVTGGDLNGPTIGGIMTIIGFSAFGNGIGVAPPSDTGVAAPRWVAGAIAAICPA